MNEKIAKLCEDQAFMAKLIALEEPSQVQALLAENGVELSLEEIQVIMKGVAARLEESDELSDDALETVAGGAVDVGGIIDAVGDAICKIGDKVHQWTRGRW